MENRLIEIALLAFALLFLVPLMISAVLHVLGDRVKETMKTESKPSDREVLAGLVERVTYQNAENGFCVVFARPQDDAAGKARRVAAWNFLMPRNSMRWRRSADATLPGSP
jgi:hypothetical protein